ncbi:tetratricopeptide repeat protein [Agriterribacter sp.]|uniref:tetratricopeptide repeat protein n=1 Tax=Agriterribacter sp. TaxID=2821509 RepID=UPI002CB73F3B|nr:tetratricopeptide repeat protein [Agriterribacter sp.]HRO48344.1 tetratricopeptide repeat protein [Agriterribacter sp.]HRQ18648.1 tetratricopeptide repeat protein [Agriterribacter sp.]
MNDNKHFNTAQIERYLSGDMPSEEKLGFEASIESNKELFDLLQIYRTIDAEMHNTEKYSSHEAALRSTLQKLNAAYFRSEAPVIRMNSRKQWYRVAMSAAAVLVLALAGYFLFFQSRADLPQLADRYVKEDLLHLSLTMDGAKDSLQQGMAAYNNKDYPQAIQLFEAVYKAHPDNSDALKYAGIAYLITKAYNRALACFDELAAKKELFSNPGVFLKAVTLLQRNQQGDKEQAEQLLQQVMDEKSDGSKEAARWLKK